MRNVQHRVFHEVFLAKAVVWTLTLALIGTISLALAHAYHEEYKAAARVLETIGATVIAGAIVSLVIEIVLVRQRDNVLRNTIEEAVEAVLPKRYTNIRKQGIFDCYNQLDTIELQSKLLEGESGLVRILVIWISDLEKIKDALRKSIDQQKSTVQIILWNTDSRDALEKRSRTIPGYTLHTYKEHITANLRLLCSIRDNLVNKDKLQVRLYDGFIATSMYGYGEIFQVGFYLNGRLSTSGIQIRVGDSASNFYNQLLHHFNDCWSHSTEPNWDLYNKEDKEDFTI